MIIRESIKKGKQSLTVIAGYNDYSLFATVVEIEMHPEHNFLIIRLDLECNEKVRNKETNTFLDYNNLKRRINELDSIIFHDEKTVAAISNYLKVRDWALIHVEILPLMRAKKATYNFSKNGLEFIVKSVSTN
jgi:hypothetical protein